jgi:hypothetical protein
VTEHKCIQTVVINELTNRIIELEKADIKIQAEVKSVKSEITALTESIDEIKLQMRAGFDRISSLVFKSMAGIIGILLTALGVLIYNYLIV